MYGLPPLAVTFTPSWMRCTSREKLMPCGGAVLSLATLAMGRMETSVFDGLWQNTQYSGLFRSVPWSDSATWHWLQLVSATTARRGVMLEPSTEKYMTGFAAPYCTVFWAVVPASTVSERRASMPTANVPVAFAGTEWVKV